MKPISPILRYLPALLLLGFTAPAHATDLQALYTTWENLRSPDVSEIPFNDGVRFLTEHPNWPEEKIIRLRTETAAFNERPGADTMRKFCSDFEPISGRGMLACAMAKASTDKAQANWIKQGWRQGDFSESEEDQILDAYRSKLTLDDHTARLERLLYEGKSRPAKRMLALAPFTKQKLYQLRIAFIDTDKKAMKLLKTLSAAEQRDTGILFERIRFRHEHDQDDQLAELFLQAPKDVPYPDAWWPMRATAVRESINHRNFAQALKVLDGHGAIKPESLAEALFLKGWIRLQHKGDAAGAYKDFFQLYTSVYTPVSKARAAYWAARAAKKNNNPDIAREWLTKAARYPTVFYGQLAYVALNPKSPLKLPSARSVSDADRKQFEQLELVQVTRAIARGGDTKMRDLFVTNLGTQATTQAQFVLLAELAHELEGIASGVEIAKLALRNGSVLINAGWPVIALPEGLPIEPALTLAITRQESEFNPTARSPANASGLMQLLPGTARQMAQKLEMNYRDDQIDDPVTNLTLGSNYLGRMIEGFDGSYILGIASYNAGPGNVRKWIATRGRPPQNAHAAIDWIETIPFSETRNYVMRVIENVGVYRTLANPETPLAIEADLAR